MDAKPTPARSFELPMMSLIRYSQDEDGFVAHALDFDLVAVGETEDEATEKIRWALQAYIEYGLQHYWDDHILFRAPEEMNDISSDTPVKLMEPIIVQDRKMTLVRATPTHEPKATVAVS
jgi:predicted RNase H-like HicB family nuclease